MDPRHVRIAPVSTSMSMATHPTVTGRNHSRGADAVHTESETSGAVQLSLSRVTREALQTVSSGSV